MAKKEAAAKSPVPGTSKIGRKNADVPVDSSEFSQVSLLAIAQEMRTVPKDGEWYALTLLATEDGLADYSWYSEFAGSTPGHPRRELRRPSLVKPQKMAALWATVGTPCLVVQNRVHLALYIRLGGTCLIARRIAEEAFEDWIRPIEVGTVGLLQPPKSVSQATSVELQHAPTPKLRAEVLKRDDYRCLACGRRPANNPDIELHVHHVALYSEGGFTTRTNLITLCHTCHKGLDPHREFKMWELLSATEPVQLPSIDDELQRYRDGVRRHRELIAKLGARIQKSNATAQATCSPTKRIAKKVKAAK